MRKKIYLLFTLILFFIFSFNVHAESLDSYVESGWVRFSNFALRWGSMSATEQPLVMNQAMHAHGGSYEALYIKINADFIVNDYQSSGSWAENNFYGRLSLCTTGTLSSGYSGADVSDVLFTGYNNIKCGVYGGHQGYLVQATYKINMRLTSSVVYNLSHWVGTNASADSYTSIVGLDFSPTPFNRFNATDTTNEYLYNILTGTSMSINVQDNTVSSKLDSVNESINSTNQKLDSVNNSLNDDDTTESSDTASSFFSGFSTDTHGLTGIITAPITLIGNITSSTCSPLQVPLPFVNKSLSLPCMSSIYSQYFGAFYNIYKIITFGIIAYWVCVRIFNLVKDFKNPEHDEIEVMDL